MTESKEAAKPVVQTPTASGVSVGRIVHYQEGENPPLAAIVTAVNGRKVSLVIFREHVQMFRQNVTFSATQKPGHWGWPPRTGA